MLAGVLCQESVPQSEAYSIHNLMMRPAPLSELDTTVSTGEHSSASASEQ